MLFFLYHISTLIFILYYSHLTLLFHGIVCFFVLNDLILSNINFDDFFLFAQFLHGLSSDFFKKNLTF